MKRKIICAVLIFAMLFSMLNIVASADESISPSDVIVSDSISDGLVNEESFMDFKNSFENKVYTGIENSNQSLSVLSDSTEEDESSYLEDMLVSVDDVGTYTMTIDHSVTPEVALYGYMIGSLGQVKFSVRDETNEEVTAFIMGNIPMGGNSNSTPREYRVISSDSNEVKTYTITASTTTGNVAFRLVLGTLETMAQDIGGLANCATIGKNTPTEGTKKYGGNVVCYSFEALLGGEGDWFHYVADGYTYITILMDKYEKLGMEVWDLESATCIFQSTAADCGIHMISEEYNSYQGYVQTALNLEAGKDYVIRAYSTDPDFVTADLSYRYVISVGCPYVDRTQYSARSTSTYSVPSRTTKTFSFNVSSMPKSAYMDNFSSISFKTGTMSKDIDIESCIFTAPNGAKFVGTYGKYNTFEFPNLEDYYGDPKNVPANGLWKVEIRTSSALSGLKFAIGGYVTTIIGNTGKE